MDAAAEVDGRTARWAGHREARRRELVAAAVTAIERHGPDVRVDQITDELGTSRHSLYRHFADRADLDRAVADSAVDSLVDALGPHLAGLDGGPEATIAAALTAYLDWITARPNLYRFVRAQEATARDPVARVKSTLAEKVAVIAHGYLLQVAGAPGRLPVGEGFAATFAAGTVGLADAAISHWLDAAQPTERGELVRLLVAMIRGAAEGVVGPLSAQPGQPAQPA